ncbi:GerMN domain-containing protein [Spirulina subsalsa FACHB-351]|uniref:GerMN domain-containing protein n=1 Tax=Spirulina subsalsa FACHB-351 TaxID=234711 RepID=A0ABT3L539_9CYAN|nr:GerMN domain-containing protein [Spirulina subsalsa]MCW6036619.1 GerMN domain-containing protein [Spirulina subsalsa FACHB-351]
MDDPNTPQTPKKSLVNPLVAGASALAILLGGGTSFWVWNQLSTPQPTVETPSEAPTGTAQQPLSPDNLQETAIQLYWLDENIELVATPATLLEKTGTIEDSLESAIQQLLDGPPDATYGTTIPEGTELRGVRLEADGIHVNLSEDFTFGGGTASMSGRVAQILYTATSLNPDGKVWLEIEGQPLEVLGGEGLILDQPLTRASYAQDFPL